jgi:twitching motility protein PilT
MDLIPLLSHAVELGASDVHFKLGQPPVIRIDGELQLVADHPPLSEASLESVLQAVTAIAPRRREAFEDSGELDIAYSHPSLPRFRVNGFRQRGSISFAFRIIPNTIAGFAELNLPAGVVRLANEHRGLILVTGATGSGKTTTLAAMLDHINRTGGSHRTIEIDRIPHPDRCIVNQREVGLDTASSIRFAACCARTDATLIGGARCGVGPGRLRVRVWPSRLSTLHTLDAAETLGRLVVFFPAAKHQQIRSIVAGTLNGVISQRLLPRTDGGRVPAVEVMVANTRIRDLIRENRPDEITDAVAEGEYYDMQTFTSLIEPV